LRRRLGEHVTQKGSLVAPDRLRFDFSHPKALSPEDIALDRARGQPPIRANAESATRLMTPDAAIEAGAMALFGEKYGEEVRVVSMGGTRTRNKDSRPSSAAAPMCARTGDIGFQDRREGAVGAGVRRIEAVTGAAAEEFVEEQQKIVHEAAAALRRVPQDLTHADRRRCSRRAHAPGAAKN
jgi:alanyl-tRNA synthetase